MSIAQQHSSLSYTRTLTPVYSSHLGNRSSSFFFLQQVKVDQQTSTYTNELLYARFFWVLYKYESMLSFFLSLSRFFFSTYISLHFLFSLLWSTSVECANVKRTKKKITKHNCITNVWLHHSCLLMRTTQRRRNKMCM
jgi:hypothetical protein